MADSDYRRGLRYASESDLIGALEARTGKKVLLHDPKLGVSIGTPIRSVGLWCSYEPESQALAFTFRAADEDGRIYTARDYLPDTTLYPATIDEKRAVAKDIISRLGANMASALAEQPLEDLLGRGY
jgi:hypothetical protein